MFGQNTYRVEERQQELLAAIEPILKQIKQLMLQKNFKRFYIPDQFNDDAMIDEFYETEILFEDKNLFASYNQHGDEIRYTIDGIYLENDELSFEVANYVWRDENKDPNNPSERLNVEDTVEVAVLYDYCPSDLVTVLQFYVELLNRYDREDAYIDESLYE